MRDQQNAGSLLRQQTQSVPQFPLRGKIQGVAGLIEQQDLRPVHQRAANEDTFGFSGGHVAHGFVAQVLDFKKAKNFIRRVAASAE